jgi:putative Holliday junction resolvase
VKGDGLGTTWLVSATLPPFPFRHDPTKTGTVLALDFGERFIGVAVGDAAVGVAHPLATIQASKARARIAAIGALIDEWRPTRLIVGLPLSPDGGRHALTDRAERFARQLGSRFRLPITMIDERFSSTEADERLRALGRGGRKHKDEQHSVAAQVILQDYFETH